MWFFWTGFPFLTSPELDPFCLSLPSLLHLISASACPFWRHLSPRYGKRLLELWKLLTCEPWHWVSPSARHVLFSGFALPDNCELGFRSVNKDLFMIISELCCIWILNLNPDKRRAAPSEASSNHCPEDGCAGCLIKTEDQKDKEEEETSFLPQQIVLS